MDGLPSVPVLLSVKQEQFCQKNGKKNTLGPCRVAHVSWFLLGPWQQRPEWSETSQMVHVQWHFLTLDTKRIFFMTPNFLIRVKRRGATCWLEELLCFVLCISALTGFIDAIYKDCIYKDCICWYTSLGQSVVQIWKMTWLTVKGRHCESAQISKSRCDQ